MVTKKEIVDILGRIPEESPLKKISVQALRLIDQSSKLELNLSEESYEGKRSSALKNLYQVRKKRLESNGKKIAGLSESIDALSSSVDAILKLIIVNLDEVAVTLWVDEKNEPYSILITETRLLKGADATAQDS